MQEYEKNKYLIETGMGLQAVDHLKNSTYFVDETHRYLNGEITLDDLDKIITSYYENKPSGENREEEADKVALRIAKIISEDAFTFTIGQFRAIHQTLFHDLLPHPGQFRKYNFSKQEWVLDGDSVTYGDYRDLEMTIQYDFALEKKFNYQGLSLDQIIEHLAIFVANLWQIHVFEEGNTRATAVFFIKYLRSLGFKVINDTFANHAWYFRNALVRANYQNLSQGITSDHSYLVKFLRNLLLDEQHELHNRELHISHVASFTHHETKETRVLAVIKANPRITTMELANELGVSVRTIKNVIQGMSLQNKIKRVNGKRYGYWQIIEKE